MELMILGFRVPIAIGIEILRFGVFECGSNLEGKFEYSFVGSKFMFMSYSI